MKKRLVLFLAVIGFLAANTVWADEVLVQPADRERVIRLQDGRQVRLPAGAELVRTPDGRLSVRRPSAAPAPAAQERVPAKAPRPVASQSAPADKATATGGERWLWFVGLEGTQRAISRDYTFSTDAITETNGSFVELVFDPTGESFYADGKSHSFSVSESFTAFGITGGLKDAENENLYQLAYHSDSEFAELVASANFGFPSISPLENLVPYAKVLAGVGFRDGISSFEANSFAYGFGVGATYPFNNNIELYFGLDMVTRNWGSEPSRGFYDENTTITYGVEERSDSENRLYLGARYFFK